MELTVRAAVSESRELKLKAPPFNVNPADIVKYGRHYWVLLLIGVVFSTPLPQCIYRKIKGSILCTVLLLAIFWGAVYCLYIGLDDPFLYFRF